MSAFPNLRSTDIISAVEDDDREMLLAVIKKYPLIASEDRGNTALQVAARMGYIDMIQCLVHASADVNYCDNDDKTPLHYAVLGDQPEAVDLLLKLGCSMDDEMASGETAPQIAFAHNYSNCVKVFLERDPKVKLKPDKCDEQSIIKDAKPDVRNSEESSKAETMKEKCEYCKEENVFLFTFEPCRHRISCLSCSIQVACKECGDAIEMVSFQNSPGTRQFIKQGEDKKKEIKQLKEEKKCFICAHNPIDCTLKKCGHVFCIECVKKKRNPTKNKKGQPIWICAVCKIPSRYQKLFGGPFSH